MRLTLHRRAASDVQCSTHGQRLGPSCTRCEPTTTATTLTPGDRAAWLDRHARVLALAALVDPAADSTGTRERADEARATADLYRAQAADDSLHRRTDTDDDTEVLW